MGRGEPTQRGRDLYHTPWLRIRIPTSGKSHVTHPGKKPPTTGRDLYHTLAKSHPQRDGTCITPWQKANPTKGRVPAKATAQATASQCSRILEFLPCHRLHVRKRRLGKGNWVLVKNTNWGNGNEAGPGHQGQTSEATWSSPHANNGRVFSRNEPAIGSSETPSAQDHGRHPGRQQCHFHP
jgi:hypothetical protein